MDKLNLVSAFYIVTSAGGFQGKWHRGLHLGEVFKGVGLKSLQDNSVGYVLTTFLFKADTPEYVMKNVLACYSVNNWGNIERTYADNDEEKKVDEEQIETYLAGWSQYSNEIPYKQQQEKKKKKSAKVSVNIPDNYKDR